MFNRSFEIPLDTGAFIQIRFDEARRALMDEDDEPNSMGNVKVQKFVTWRGPEEGGIPSIAMGQLRVARDRLEEVALLEIIKVRLWLLTMPIMVIATPTEPR